MHFLYVSHLFPILVSCRPTCPLFLLFASRFHLSGQGTEEVESSKLAANPDITLCIQRLNDEKVRRESQSALALSISDKTRVLEKLRDWMNTAEPSDTNKIAAARLLGQSVGLFKEVIEQNVERTSDDVARQLEDRLASLLEGSDSEGVTSEQEQGSVH